MCISFCVLGTDLKVEGYARGAYYIFHEDPICNGQEGGHVALNQGHIGKVLMQTKSWWSKSADFNTHLPSLVRINKGRFSLSKVYHLKNINGEIKKSTSKEYWWIVVKSFEWKLGNMQFDHHIEHE